MVEIYEVKPNTIDSVNFAGCYYKVIGSIGGGGQGSVDCAVRYNDMQ